MSKSIFEVAKEAALLGGSILKEGFGTAFKISNKEGRNNLVTEYDHKSEEAIINLIKTNFPEHTFLAEESGATGDESKSELRWIIDPLDGTVNYAHSLPIFSVSIAAEKNGEIICGVIYQPMTDEIFYAEKGNGAFYNGERISVSETSELRRAFLVTGFPYNVNENPSNCLTTFTDIIGRGIPVRRLGSAAMDLAYLAAGKFDAFWETTLKPWDVAAGVLILEEAGGKITQFDNSAYTIYDQTMLATNGKIHDEFSNAIMETYKL